MTADPRNLRNLSKDIQAHKLESLGQFAGGIAHDFNNILSIIEGHTQAAIKRLKEGSLTPEHLERIMLSTQRGAGLTRQLLSFGRQTVALEETVNLAEVVQRHGILLSPLLGEMIRLKMEIGRDPLWVNASEDHLMQIVLNLSLNARDAMPRGGDMVIAVAAQGDDKIRLTVMDTGGGIPVDVLPRIFDPFFTTKERGKGTGLGLSVVYGLVDQLGGRVDVATGKHGTSFHVDFPRAEVPLLTVQDSVPEVVLKGKTILIAEDEPELRDIIAVMLSEMDMRVLKASNGNDAMRLQHDFSGDIDFLLTDVVMPEMDGLRLGKLFTVRRPDTNVIYMSGYPFMDASKEMTVPDQADFIPKPMQEETVRQVLERALKRRDERLKAEKDDKDGEKK